MEEQTESRTPISGNDLPGLVSIINQYLENIDPENNDILKQMKHLFLGLSSHNINKRKGYTLIVNYLLRTYKEQISEESAMNFCDSIKFGKDKQKTAIRTGNIAKILTYTSFIKSEIITSEDSILKIINEIHSIGAAKPNLAPFAFTVLVEIQDITHFAYLQYTMELMKRCLDSFIFIFKVSQICPQEFREFLPESFRPSTFNENTAKNLYGTAAATKQPWNSGIWKVIANETPIDDLHTFWPQVVGKLIRSTEQSFKQNICALYIVKSVLPTLRPDVYNIVISSTFIRMINSLIMKPQLQPQINEFLNFVVDLAEKNNEILINIIEEFWYIDFRQPGGFEFHLGLYDKCDEETLNQIFVKIQNFDNNDKLELMQRFASQKTNDIFISKFKLDTLRVAFISSSRFPNPSFTLLIFKYISENWKEHLTILVPDIVKYDSRRVEGSASLSDLIEEPELTDFEACYKLYSLCTGASSSPSLNTLIPPKIDDSPPSSVLIHMAIEHASDSVLISYAFKTYVLKKKVPNIQFEEIMDFFGNYNPSSDSFSTAIIDIFQIVLENMKTVNYNIISPIFSLFCKTATNISANSNLIQLASDLIKTSFNLLSNASTSNSITVNVRMVTGFQFPEVLDSIFNDFSSLPQNALKQNQKLINRTFEMTVCSIIKAAMPLSGNWAKCLKKNLDKAVEDFAIKSNQHFDESFFSAFLRLPDDVTQFLFPITMKYLPKVTRLQRRVHLIDLVTLFFNKPKGADILLKYENDFNDCVKKLLDESFMQKDDEKRFIKFIIALTKWFSSMENKRNASSHINIGDIKRKLSSIQNMAHEPLLGSVKQCILALQRVETQIHPKHRIYT